MLREGAPYPRYLLLRYGACQEERGSVRRGPRRDDNEDVEPAGQRRDDEPHQARGRERPGRELHPGKPYQVLQEDIT